MPRFNGKIVLAPEFDYVKMQIDKDTKQLNYYKEIKEPDIKTLSEINKLEERISKNQRKISERNNK